MSNILLIDAVMGLDFEEIAGREDYFKQEFTTIGMSDDDAIGQWLRAAKAKGDTSESDPVVLHLIVELYRKMDRLENLILGNMPTRIPLLNHTEIVKIGLEHFELAESVLDVSKSYYGRLDLPTHPQRETAFYFEALTPKLAKIVQIHTKASNEWCMYMRARERMMIRQLKGLE